MSVCSVDLPDAFFDVLGSVFVPGFPCVSVSFLAFPAFLAFTAFPDSRSNFYAPVDLRVRRV